MQNCIFCIILQRIKQEIFDSYLKYFGYIFQVIIRDAMNQLKHSEICFIVAQGLARD